MKTFLLLFAIGIAFTLSCTGGHPIAITITNPSDIARQNEPVAVDFKKLQKTYPGIDLKTIAIADSSGKVLPTQIDDLNGDKKWDELVFLADFEPKETRKFFIKRRTENAANSDLSAKIWQRLPEGDVRAMNTHQIEAHSPETQQRYAAVSWGSADLTLQLRLDGSNSIEPFRPTGWMSKADFPGIAGLAFWAEDSIFLPKNLYGFNCWILANGPVRSLVRLDFKDWKVGKDYYKVTWLIMQYAHSAVVEHRVYLKNLQKDSILPTAITGLSVTPETVVISDAKHGWLYAKFPTRVWGKTLAAAIIAPVSQLVSFQQTDAQFLLPLRFTKDRPLRYFSWCKPSMQDDETHTLPQQEVLFKQLFERLNTPLQIHFR